MRLNISFLKSFVILTNMNGVIVNFCGGRHTQIGNQMVVLPENAKDAKALVGKAVTWKSPAGKEIKGKITKEHGRNGAVKVIFDTGMPGQSVGQKVSIV